MNRIYSLFLTLGCLTTIGSGLIYANEHAIMPECRLPETKSVSRQMRVAKLDDSKWDNTDGHDIREVHTEGDLPVLVILVNFQDNKYAELPEPKEKMYDLLNSENYTLNGATGSARDYFNFISDNRFHPTFDIYGPVTLDNDEAYYAQTDQKYTDESGKEVSMYAPGLMIKEAVEKLDSEIDFTKYDANKDGLVDFVYVFFAGKTATSTSMLQKYIGAHAYTLTSAIGEMVEVDGVKVDRYATSGELNSDNKLTPVGTFCHEFSHVLGLPDYYDTANNGSSTDCFSPGSFSLMDAGMYNNSGYTPPVYSSYERYAIEWLKPIEITGTADVTLLPMTAPYPMAYKINDIANPQEYFLFEARAKHYWDSYLDAAGLAVWHIDFDLDIWQSNKVNNTASHQRIDLVEADNNQTSTSRSGDLFPGYSTVCEYTSELAPLFVNWDKKSVGYSVKNIMTNPDGTVSLRFESKNGNKMDGMELASPCGVRCESVDESSFTVKWDNVAGAKGYRVTVYPLSAFDGSTISSFVDGYYFKDLGSATSVDVANLAAGTNYGVYVYAYTDLNVSRLEVPAIVTTLSSADTSNLRPSIYVANGNEDATLYWTAIDSADKYLLTVATQSVSDSSDSVVVDFTDSRLPENWNGSGDYDKRDAYSGSAAPSYKLSSNGDFLKTPVYEKDIKSVKFWTRQRFSDDICYIDVYGEDADGVLSFVSRLSDFVSKAPGETRIVNMPEGCKSVKLVFTTRATGLDAFIDDVELSFVEGWTNNPLSGYDNKELTDTKEYVSGLANGTTYVAYVKAVVNGNETQASKTVEFTPDAANTGVKDLHVDNSLSSVISLVDGELIPSDGEMSYNVFTLAGYPVAKGVKGNYRLPARGLYLICSGSTSMKVVW
jgi:M6 family metalloprotease-like protein